MKKRTRLCPKVQVYNKQYCTKFRFIYSLKHINIPKYINTTLKTYKDLNHILIFLNMVTITI